jgi:2-polyprenyl-3-methyl-5-hydroxy-6-metoxy-1,4-benzoquinol methylase
MGQPMRITKEYREANRQLHETNPKYGSSSAKWAPKVLELAGTTASRSVLDYGCGKGQLAPALPQFDVREYDPAIEGKDAEPEPADLVVCTDVLEHIEPDCLDDVLRHIAAATKNAAFLNIATRAAVKTLPDGRNAHLIIQSQDWWRGRVEAIFEIIEWAPDRDFAVSALVRPRRSPTAAKGGAAWFKIPGVQDGRWGLDRQMAGLDVVRRAASGASVLDLGCAEAMVSLELAESGAKLVHGVELEAGRLRVAEQIFEKECPRVARQFIEWDLSRFDELFLDVTPDSRPGQPLLRTRYDIVLCLAIAQKLPNPGRFLRLAATLCTDIIAVRLPYPVIDDARSLHVPVDVKRMLMDEFDLVQETEGYPRDLNRPYKSGDEAWLGIFRRRQ